MGRGVTYNNGSGTVFVFNKTDFRKNETLYFNIDSPLNSTYYDGTPQRSPSFVINVNAEAQNPFLGTVTTWAKPITMILSSLSPATFSLY